ncbi:hypothetical protein [Natrinema marinum]|uniref:hypothetical protein n=1 Tax=Natrinema marinum TaxID=2961598 RepID=UPI0020C852A4|nr:hypothetical protein [Natrinema marinum]
MDRTEWFLALITYLLAAIALETVSDATNELSREVGGTVSLLILTLLPLYLLAHVVIKHHEEPDWSNW